jgi:hypothetical protein
MKLPIPDGLSALIQPLRVPLWLRLRRAAIFCAKNLRSLNQREIPTEGRKDHEGPMAIERKQAHLGAPTRCCSRRTHVLDKAGWRGRISVAARMNLSGILTEVILFLCVELIASS